MSEGPKQAEVTVVQEKPKASTTAKAGVGLSIGALVLLVFQMFGPMIMDALHVDKATQQKLIDAAKQLEEEQKKREEAEAKAEKLEQEKAAAVKPGPTILIEQPKPPVEKTSDVPPPKAIDPAIIQQWIDLFRQVIDNLPKPKPEPKPEPDPKPLPPNPKPEPPNPPTPTPVSLKFRLTDASGQEITSATVNAGKLILVRLVDPTVKVAWHATPSSDDQQRVQAAEWPDHTGYAIVLASQEWLDLTAIDAKLSKVSMRITANQGPQPPPNPPIVDPPKPQPISNDLKAVIIYESEQNHSSSQDAILHSTALAALLDAKCTKGSDGRSNWRKWDKDLTVDPSSTMGKIFTEALPQAKQQGLPVIAVACGDSITVYPIGPSAKLEQVELVLNCGVK